MKVDVTHLSSLFEHATEGIILTRGGGTIVMVNPAAQRMFGYQAEELAGLPIEVLIPARFTERHVALRNSFAGEPQNRVMGHGRDLHALKKDGTEFPVEVSLGYYRREGELYVIAFVVDITTRKQIEASLLRKQAELEQMASQMQKLNAELEKKVEERTIVLREALERLEESRRELNEALEKEKILNEIKSRFISIASHEFRTPLSTVLSSASLLGRYTRTEDQPQRDRHLEKIRNAVRHLNDILEDFLSLGKLDEGKVAIQPAAFDLNEFLQEMVEEMQPLLKEGQTIRLSHAGRKEIITDRRLLKNILINLLTNAIKFSGEHQEVRLRANAAEDATHIEVADQGIGIPEDDREHLFTSFYRARNVSNIQGTGLGLHIVKRYLDLLGGSVDLESALDAGTTVIVHLPDLEEKISP